MSPAVAASLQPGGATVQFKPGAFDILPDVRQCRQWAGDEYAGVLDAAWALRR